MHVIHQISLLALSGATALALPVAESSAYGPGTPQGLPPLPFNLTSGIHHFDFGTDGKPNITKVANLDLKKSKLKDDTLDRRVDTWTGCEKYSFTNSQRIDVEKAWAGLLNWASADGTGASPWIYGHYFALTDSGTYAYLCEWSTFNNGNHATVSEVNQAHGILGPACNNGPGIFQWNGWQKGIGVAATGQKWCNNQNPA